MSAEHDTDLMGWRAELASMAFEGTFVQIRALVRFLELGEYQLAVAALERAMPFWRSALEEMRAIRTKVRSEHLTGKAAAEYRAERARCLRSKKSEAA